MKYYIRKQSDYLEIAVESNFGKLPIYNDDGDTIVGYEPIYSDEVLINEYGYSIIELPYDDILSDDFDDLIFNEEKYLERKSNELRIRYYIRVNELIRERYTLSEELSILRQRDSKKQEYDEYYKCCEECKAKAKNIFS